VSFIIHQALFGQDQQHGQGYELLQTTHPDKGLVRQMGNSTDLIETVPSQIAWQPALRGRAWKGFYLLFRTYADKSPDVRPGRVFSHALIIEQRMLAQLSDIRPLLELFPPQLNKEVGLQPVEWQPLKKAAIPLTPRLGYLLKELVNPTRTGPIIWAGQAGFDAAAALFWQCLTAAERGELNLNVGFMPHQLRDVSAPLQLIAVPEAILPRWKAHHFVIAATDAHAELSEAEAYLAGDTTRAPSLTALLQKLATPTADRAQLDMLQRVAPTAATLAQAPLQDVLTLATVLHWYHPGPTEVSQQALARLVQLVHTSSVGELNRLRSVTKDMLPADALDQLAAAASAQIPTLLAKLPAEQLVPLLAWEAEPLRQWWREGLRVAVSSVFKSGGTTTGELVVRLLEQPWGSVKDYVRLLPATPQIENLLLESLPTSWPKAAWENGASLAQAQHWYRLYMTSQLHLVPLAEALQRQLAYDTAPTHVAALRLAVAHAKPKDFVAAAAELDDQRITQLAGELCAKQPALLRTINVAVSGWQEIWLATARQTGNVWTGIQEPMILLSQLLDEGLTGNVAPALLELISVTPYADIRGYKNRKEVWSTLPTRARTAFLRATARGLLTHNGADVWASKLEPELAALFGSGEFQTEIFTYPALSLASVVEYSKRFVVSEHTVLRYLRGYRGTPPAAEARAFGQLVMLMRWSTTADELFTLSRVQPGWQEALAGCLQLLGVMNRFLAYLMPGLATLPTRQQLQDSWWRSLQEALLIAYYEGPLQDGLWEESGGENHEINTRRSVGEQWIDAIRRLRTRKTRARVDLLMDAISKQHPRNDTFTTLRHNLAHA
jgi:GTPase-associated protein 1, N-terminal domain type 1/Effector-associated domain 1